MWQHSSGCRRWITVRRNTYTHDIIRPASPIKVNADKTRCKPQRKSQNKQLERTFTLAFLNFSRLCVHAANCVLDFEMSSQPFRLASGGLIDRKRPLAFSFNGRRLTGYAGDSLASALLANGVTLVGRSFKYHRPRGIVCAGADEPNALVQLETGARTEPNLRATQIELYDGLVAASQNCWPSVGFDVGSVNNLLSRLMPSGFYYKTFMWPASLWMTYEKVIRKVAGMGRAPDAPDPDRLRASLRALRRAGRGRRSRGACRSACRSARGCARDRRRRTKRIRRQPARRRRRYRRRTRVELGQAHAGGTQRAA